MVDLREGLSGELWGQWCKLGLEVDSDEIQQGLVDMVRNGTLFQFQSEALKDFEQRSDKTCTGF